MRLQIVCIAGDGVGREMTEAALAVFRASAGKHGHIPEISFAVAAGEAIERFGEPLPQASLEICKSARAILMGNIGLKKYQNLPHEKRPEYVLMRLRKELAVTTNIRPVKAYPRFLTLSPLKDEQLSKGMDVVFVRDIAGGILCSKKVEADGTGGHEAYEYEYYNEEIVRHTARYAFRIAEGRKKKLVNLDKANVLASSVLWRHTIENEAKKYPGILLSHCYIDTAAMRLIAEQDRFDVIVTSNVFGDIIADEGTQLTGTPYLYASAELATDGRGIYTPNQLHYPDESIIGKNLVNPIGMILSAALMLRFSFGLEKEAAEIERAVEAVLAEGIVTQDLRLIGAPAYTTSEVTGAVLQKLMDL